MNGSELQGFYERQLLADIVGQVEIADRLGWSRQALGMRITRDANWPAPVLSLRAGRFYRWSEVLVHLGIDVLPFDSTEQEVSNA